MADVAPTPNTPIVVPSDEKPTLANSEAINGALIGSALGGDHEVLGAVAGGAIGGMIGKERMEREYTDGRTVKPPSAFGWEMALSITVFTALALAAGAVFFGAAVGALVLCGIGGAVAGAVAGTIVHNRQMRDYEKAQSYYTQHGGNYQGREREAQKAPQITPEEQALLEQRIAAGRGSDYGQGVAANAAALASSAQQR